MIFSTPSAPWLTAKVIPRDWNEVRGALPAVDLLRAERRQSPRQRG